METISIDYIVSCGEVKGALVRLHPAVTTIFTTAFPRAKWDELHDAWYVTARHVENVELWEHRLNAAGILGHLANDPDAKQRVEKINPVEVCFGVQF